MKECITHHNACDCREAKFQHLEKKLVFAVEALELVASSYDERHMPMLQSQTFGQSSEYVAGWAAGRRFEFWRQEKAHTALKALAEPSEAKGEE